MVRVFWSTLPAERVVVEPVERLVVAELELPVERLVRVFWSTLPAERVVEEPVERLTEEELLPICDDDFGCAWAPDAEPPQPIATVDIARMIAARTQILLLRIYPPDMICHSVVNIEI